MRALHELDPWERRVIGVLLEKEQTTPEYYPLTTKSLVAGCNQATNREPVVTLLEYEVLRVLERLEREGMVERESGARADRWKHLLVRALHAEPSHKAVLTLLLLRGAQTPGELRGRAQRMHGFDTLEGVETVLRRLADEGIVRPLARQPGQKEVRWTLATGEAEGESEPPAVGREPSLEARLDRLEALVERILQKLEMDSPDE